MNRNKKESIKIIRIILLGSGGVGKTSYIQRLLHNEFSSDYFPIFEETYQKTFFLENNTIKVELMDTSGGSTQYQSSLDSYLQLGDGIILFFSFSSINSINEAKEMLNAILLDKRYQNFPILIVGNKKEYKNINKNEEKEVKEMKEEFEDVLKKRKMNYFEISCKLNENIQISFNNIVHSIIQPKLKKSPSSSSRSLSSCLIS